MYQILALVAISASTLLVFSAVLAGARSDRRAAAADRVSPANGSMRDGRVARRLAELNGWYR